MHTSFWKRLLSLALILSLLSGFVVLSEPTAEAASSTGSSYADPASTTELDKVETWFAANNGAESTGTYAKVINGTVYTWGSNARRATGLESYVNSAGETVAVGTNTSVTVDVPTAIDKSNFGGENVILVTAGVSVFVAVTESYKVYVWGHSGGGKATDYSTYQRLVDTSEITSKGRSIVKVRTCGASTFLEDDQGNWYSFGVSGATDLLQGTADEAKANYPNYATDYTYTAHKIPSAILKQVGGGILDVSGMWSYTTIVIGTNGQLYGFGKTLSRLGYTAYPKNADGTQSDGVDIPIKYNGIVSVWKNTSFKQIWGEDWGVGFVDSAGNVWGLGANGYDHFGNSETYNDTAIDASHKVFSSDTFQKKAVRVWVSSYRTCILCEDNTVYALGYNYNGCIDPNKKDENGNFANVDTPTQIYTDVSKSATIVAVFASNTSQIAITKAGDMYFSGDNSTGAAGNGTTDQLAAGEVTAVVSANLPPSQPVTTNKVTFEIEVKESDGRTYYYVPAKDSSGKQIYADGTSTYKYVNGEDTGSVKKGRMIYQRRGSKSNYTNYMLSALTLDAGTTFKLNVYFDDFGKINTFVMPIRFDQNYVQVVNGSGEAYSTSKVVTPGSIGTSVGIIQDFDTTDWNGGALAVGTSNGTYPKICNGGGWVSVAGYAYSDNPEIVGNVEMFSITFRATQQNTNGVAFDFATSENANDGATEPSYDAASNGVEKNTAYWSIINTAVDASATGNGYFEFTHDSFPSFYTQLNKAAAITLTLTYGDNDAEVTKPTETTSISDTSCSWDLNWGNTGVVYKMTAHLFSDTKKTKENVSFPYVDWTISLVGGDGTKELEDYITIIEQTDTYVRFRINQSFTPSVDSEGNVDEPEAAIKFFAKYQDTTVNVSGTDAARLMSMEPPSEIFISQKSGGNYVPVADGTEIIYNYAYSDDKMGTKETFAREFYVTYGSYAGTSREVVWSLLDSDGNTIYSTDADAKAVLSNDSTDTKDSSGNIIPSVTVLPYYSNAGDDYLTLRCESLYDSNIYDEVTIKVHLVATKIAFSPETICIPVSTDLSSSTVKLAKYLGLTPVDAWSTDYTWTVKWPDSSEAPGNWTKLYGDDAAYNADDDAVVYGQLNGSTGELIAFEYATPSDDPVVVTATDSVSGQSASITVKIMDVDSPIGINDFEATNNLGYMNDTLKILDGLNPSGKTITSIALYSNYDKAVEELAKESTTLEPFKTVTISDDIRDRYDAEGYFSIAAYSGQTSLFDNAGGFIGVVVTYTVGQDPTEITSDVVPVQYDQEPNIVDGYVRLFGRDINSVQQAGIRIDLVGLNFKETVYTDSDGYFKFTKYIAPGTYSMTISKTNYLTRYIQTDSKGNGGIVIPVNEESEKFHISTTNSPIYLYPGELTSDNAITIQDVTYYVANWVGITDKTISNFTLYDFVEDGVISTKDLELILMRKDWTNESYPAWTVPDQ
jgi:alpha-tubulin suppressor-like RCC1 family protein